MTQTSTQWGGLRRLRGAHLCLVTYHVRQLDVGKAVDQGLAQVGQLVQERLILLLDDFVLLLNRLQVALHCGDLKSHIWVTCNMRLDVGSKHTGWGDKDRSFLLKQRLHLGDLNWCLWFFTFEHMVYSDHGGNPDCSLSLHWMLSGPDTLIYLICPCVQFIRIGTVNFSVWCYYLLWWVLCPYRN